MKLRYRVLFILSLLVFGGLSLGALSTSPHLVDSQNLVTNKTTVEMSAQDKALVMQIQQQIAQDPLLKNFNIVPSSSNGVVTLDGTVDSNAQAAAAVEDTKKVVGVKDIKSNIIVKNATQ